MLSSGRTFQKLSGICFWGDDITGKTPRSLRDYRHWISGRSSGKHDSASVWCKGIWHLCSGKFSTGIPAGTISFVPADRDLSDRWKNMEKTGSGHKEISEICIDQRTGMFSGGSFGMLCESRSIIQNPFLMFTKNLQIYNYKIW